MARNDIILVDGIIDERTRHKIPSDDRGEAFEFFAMEQLLKESDLSNDEIVEGLVDGSDDGGIDGFYILVDGHLLTDLDAFRWPKRNAELEVRIVTCKVTRPPTAPGQAS